MSRYIALVPAAGSGARFGSEIPKQYLMLLGRPLIYHTLSVLCREPLIERVCVILSPDDTVWDRFDWTAFEGKLHPLYCGGETRAQTVLHGMQALQNVLSDEDWVLVHDAARPCLSSALLRHLMTQLAKDPVGGLLAVPLADTLKFADANGRVQETRPRDHLWQAQTPQMFRYGLLHRALLESITVTDEASAIEALGLHPQLVLSEMHNFKVTYPHDLRLAEAILQGVNA